MQAYYYPALRDVTQMTSRNFVFTINNPDSQLTPDEDDWAAAGVRYAIWQFELGEELTPHIQGYIEFNRSVRRAAVVKLDGMGRAYVDVRRGSREQAREYCSKPDSRIDGPYEWGEWKSGGQGRRSDLAEVGAAVLRGDDILTIINQFPTQFIRYSAGITRALTYLTKPRNHLTKLTLILGKPGLGKTHWVKATYPTAYWKQPSNWWCGMANAKTVVLDEFYGWLQPDRLLRLADQTPLKVETKGGQAEFVAEDLIIISNKMPHEWWSPEVWQKIDSQALYRRITKVMQFYAFGQWTEYDGWADFDDALAPRLTQHLPVNYNTINNV